MIMLFGPNHDRIVFTLLIEVIIFYLGFIPVYIGKLKLQESLL